MIAAVRTISQLAAIVSDPDGNPLVSSSPTPEVTDAEAVLARLKAAATTYERTLAAVHRWRNDYQLAFTLLDRRARYVLSLTTTAPAALRFADDQAMHTALVSRADSAAGTGVSARVLADLARFRTALDSLWSAKPNPDSTAEAIALLAALDEADGCIAFMMWARGNPT